MRRIVYSGLVGFVFAFVFALVPFSAAQEAKAHSIPLHRPLKKGDSYDAKISVRSTSTRTVRVGRRINQSRDEVLRGTIAGQIKILEVDADGAPERLELVVSSFTMKLPDDDQETEALPAGRKLLMETKQGQKVFSVNGEEADGPTMKLLREMFAVPSKSATVKETALLGLDKPRAPADSWTLSVTEIPGLIDSGFKVDEKESTGKMALKEVRKVEGMDCAAVEGGLTFRLLGLKEGNLDVTVDRSNAAGTIKAAIPLDATAPIPQQTTTLRLSFSGTFKTPAGTESSLRIFMDQMKDVVVRNFKRA